MAEERGTKPFVVVVGVDYSELSAVALERAFELAAARPGAELHAVNVVRNFGEFVMLEAAQPSSYPSIYPSSYGVSLREASQRLQDYVDEARQRFEGRHGPGTRLRCITHLRAEIPAEEIVALATEVGADVIVVGTHGRRGVRRLVLGSVAESVVRLADCAVLVVRQPRDVTAGRAAGVARADTPSAEGSAGGRDYPPP